MRAALPFLALASVAQALYFYVDGSTPKCFFEELPKDTLVVGHYTAEEWDDHRQAWWPHDGLSIYISVDETFNDAHRVVSQRGGSSSKFTFTAHDAGDHKICFTPSSTSGRSGWLSSASPNGGVRLTLDLAIGESSAIESKDKSKLEDIVTRVRDLNARLADIRREQVFQRVSVSDLAFAKALRADRTLMESCYLRSERPSFATSPNQPTPASSAGS